MRLDVLDYYLSTFNRNNHIDRFINSHSYINFKFITVISLWYLMGMYNGGWSN
jgi:hypothetical protein